MNSCLYVFDMLISDMYYSEMVTIEHIYLQRWTEHHSPSIQEHDMHLSSLVLLLKCLKIMENATFLSKDNQVQRDVILFCYSSPVYSFSTQLLELKMLSEAKLLDFNVQYFLL